MKILIYTSGIIGAGLMILRILGIFISFSQNDLILMISCLLLGGVFIPALILERYRQNKKIDEIIKSYKGNSEPNTIGDNKPQTPGWGMNNSPFRERKSSVSWGGGNIKGSIPSRGSRKQFLKGK
jgi:hypothetical protein